MTSARRQLIFDKVCNMLESEPREKWELVNRAELTMQHDDGEFHVFTFSNCFDDSHKLCVRFLVKNLYSRVNANVNSFIVGDRSFSFYLIGLMACMYKVDWPEFDWPDVSVWEMIGDRVILDKEVAALIAIPLGLGLAEKEQREIKILKIMDFLLKMGIVGWM